MQFQVPQFIEMEDKIVGPLTLKQFIYLAAAGLISFLLFFVLKLWFWFIVTAILGTTAAILAFLKYNGRPMPVIIASALKYATQPKLYLWKKSEEIAAVPEIKIPEAPRLEIVSPLKRIWLKITTTLRIPTQMAQKERLDVYKQAFSQKRFARKIDYR